MKPRPSFLPFPLFFDWRALRLLGGVSLAFALATFPASAAEDDEAPADNLPALYQTGTLREVIERLYGQPVLPYAGQSAEALEAAATRALAILRREGVTAGRVNEVGNAVESFVVEALRAEGFEADTPRTVSGRRQSAGYPDVVARRGGETFYLEIKTYHPRNADTTQRSFYLSPSADPKVTEPAFHLLIGFAMLPAEDAVGRYHAQSVRLLDLSALELGLKLEFNASNRDLYGEAAGLALFALESSEDDVTD